MANKVVLDAMIKRADFAQESEGEDASIALTDKLTIEDIAGEHILVKLLRKPDFQRETNHWSPSQVSSLIKSFANNELIPGLILWKSDSFVFVIDGAHRLSALRAWVANDYGDGPISAAFFGGKLPNDQIKRAKATRRMVEREVGRFSDLRNIGETELNADKDLLKKVNKIFTRSLHVQWIQGNSAVAEASFFKINSQGTPLDDVEELLLRNRKKSYAIAARSVVRAGTGHKYWSTYSTPIKEEIEELSSRLNDLLFQPEVDEPIKTLDLPLGGAASPVDALKMLVDIFVIIDGGVDPKKAMEALKGDDFGQETIEVLKRCLKVTSRLTGNEGASLGLHPAVYFYTERGVHSRFLFLGILKAFSIAIRNNDKDWFSRFTQVRKRLETILVERKSLINQGLANINSRQRIDRVANLVKELVKHLKVTQEISDEQILLALGLEGSAGDLKIIDAPKGFTTDIKSAAFLQAALANAPACAICGSYLHTVKAVSYDHALPVSKGGVGKLENIQLSHPYCNTAYKNSAGG